MRLSLWCVRTALFLAPAGCGAGSAPTVLTVEARRTDFREFIEVDGALEAKSARTLVTPRVWPQPTIGYLAPEGSTVKKDDVVVQFESEEIERRYVQAVTELELARADAQQKEAQLEAERLTQQAAMQSAAAEAEIARLQLNRLSYVAPRVRKIQELQIRKSELRAEKARKRMAALAAIQAEDRNRTGAQIRKAETQLKKQEKFLRDLTLRAPADGIVVHEKNGMTGEPVKEGDGLYAGMSVVRIPDPSVMQVKVFVNELDAQRIEVGQPASVLVPSLGSGALSARVTRVEKRAQPVKRGSKVKHVEVLVELDPTGEQPVPASGGRDARVVANPATETRGDSGAALPYHRGLTSGLTGIARILVKQTPDTFVLPLDCLFTEDSTTVVYVRTNDTYAAVDVKVETRGDDFAVITGALAEGARIALRKPWN